MNLTKGLQKLKRNLESRLNKAEQKIGIQRQKMYVNWNTKPGDKEKEKQFRKENPDAFIISVEWV